MSHPVTSVTAEVNEPAPASIAVCTRGGHLTSWVADGVERLWMSPVSHCGQADAIRGGVPILFPQFGTYGPLPKHGFARNSVWHQVATTADPGTASVTLRLHDSAETRAIWATPFELTLQTTATAQWLEQTLTVRNLDDYDAHFTGGLHNYFPINPSARITGLGGLRGWDAVTHPGQPEALVELADELDPVAERDVIVHDVSVPVQLDDPVLGRLEITATGFPARVVWNPGPGQTLPDVPRGAESGFVCIEPVAVPQVRLPGGGTWVGTQRLTIVS